MKGPLAIASDTLQEKLVSHESPQGSMAAGEVGANHVVVGPSLSGVAQSQSQNSQHQHQHAQHHHAQHPQIIIVQESDDNDYDLCCAGKFNLCDAYLLLLPFAGLFGAHHFYLRRPKWGVLYIFTFALLGFGWIVDLIRLPCLVERAQKDYLDRQSAKRQGLPAPTVYCDLFDAYILAFPLGWLGLHHFYLGRPGWGFLYFFTFGLLGLGFVTDLIRMPILVANANAEIKRRESLRAVPSALPVTSVPAVTVVNATAV